MSFYLFTNLYKHIHEESKSCYLFQYLKAISFSRKKKFQNKVGMQKVMCFYGMH